MSGRRKKKDTPPPVNFDVSVNQKHLCRAGFAGHGVLSAMVTWVRRRDGSGDFDLKVGGLNDADENLEWVDQPLKSGDEVRIKVLDASSEVDPPAETRLKDTPEESLRLGLQYVLNSQIRWRRLLQDPSALAEALMIPSNPKLLGVSPGDSFREVTPTLPGFRQRPNPEWRTFEVASVDGNWGMYVRKKTGKVLSIWSSGPELQTETTSVRIGDTEKQAIAPLGEPEARTRKNTEGTGFIHYPSCQLALCLKGDLVTTFYLGTPPANNVLKLQD